MDLMAVLQGVRDLVGTDGWIMAKDLASSLQVPSDVAANGLHRARVRGLLKREPTGERHSFRYQLTKTGANRLEWYEAHGSDARRIKSEDLVSTGIGSVTPTAFRAPVDVGSIVQLLAEKLEAHVDETLEDRRERLRDRADLKTIRRYVEALGEKVIGHRVDLEAPSEPEEPAVEEPEPESEKPKRREPQTLGEAFERSARDTFKAEEIRRRVLEKYGVKEEDDKP